MHTAVYVYPGVIDESVKGFIDGAENTLPGDGATYYGRTDGFKFHTFTFKTKSTLPSEGYVLFRLWPNTVIGRESDGATGGIAYTDICMTKLEEGMMATGYVANEKSLMGDRGPMLRGPQAWSDCAVGYKFQAGGSGDEFKDVVLYNGNYYSCIKNHAKTARNYPTSTPDTNNGYWKLGDKIELVATKILLATYALVKNLGVEAIDMKDSKGNILFQAKDGVVTCKTGNFENVVISGILKSNLFYGKTRTITTASDQTYNIDPATAPALTYFIDEPTNSRFVRLPNAVTYDGLEIQVFTKCTNWNINKMTRIGAGVSGQVLYFKQNIYNMPFIYIEAQQFKYKWDVSKAVEVFNEEYKAVASPDTLFMQPNMICKFKAMNGAWYAIQGLWTGE